MNSHEDLLTALREANETIRVGDIELDRAARIVRVHGQPVELALKEFELLELLMTNAGRALPRSAMLALLWGHPHSGDPKTLDVHILRLRKKIEPNRRRPTHIRTLRRYGYIFDR